MPGDYASALYRYQLWVPHVFLRRLVARTVGVQNRKQSPSQRSSEPAGKDPSENLDLPAIWKWQFDHHEGFVHSFARTVRDGPIQYQQNPWQNACEIICGKDSGSTTSSKLRNSQVLVVCGESDGVIVAAEVVEDLTKLLPDHLVVRTVEGGHGFPYSSGEATSRHICEFLNLG